MVADHRSDEGARRVLLVDDHPLLREGLNRLFGREPDFDVCGEATAGREALERAGELRPHLAIVDLSLPDMDGIDLIKDLATRHPDVLILVVSMHDEEVYAERCLRAGARGYVMKGEPPEAVIAAARRVLEGAVHVSESLSEKIMGRLAGADGEGPSSPVDDLSDRELQVFTLIGEGLGPSDIARRLHLSVKTIETYRANMKQKLGVPDATELRQYAIQWTQSQRGLRRASSADEAPPAAAIGESPQPQPL